jgi:Kef-type K+ transport system membrane component KefB
MIDAFFQISAIVIIATAIAGIMKILRQPLIVGYILTGIIVSPIFLNIVHTTETIEIFSHLGVALLLFLAGLNLNPKLIREVWVVSSVAGIGQIVFTSVIGFLIATALGFSVIVSIYLAVALTLSSTIIVLKLLLDKNELETLHGRISIGILLIQDMFVIFVLMFVSSTIPGTNLIETIIGTMLKGVGLIFLLFLIGIFVFPRIDKYVAKSQEFLFLFSMAWLLALASLFNYLRFSIEIGALLAGVTLSMSPYRHEIILKMRPLRDFFIILFFIFLGLQIIPTHIWQYSLPILVFSAFILIGNPLIVMILMGMLGFTKRNSFLTGTNIAQISEFSFILIALGVAVGHLPVEILSFITVVGLVTIGGSTYFITHADRIYSHLSYFLSIFERKGKKIDEHRYHREYDYDVILFGCDRIGFDILNSFEKMRTKCLVIDHNPEVILNLAKRGVDCKYGDADDIELLNELNFDRSKMIVSTIPDLDTNLLMINKIREENECGATYVLMPHFLSGHHVATMIRGIQV